MTEVALRLKGMLLSSSGGGTSSGSGEGGGESGSADTALPSVTAVLLSLIEPPSLRSIQQALHTLYRYGLLTSSAADSALTEIGALAASLPVDFMLGRFIGYAGALIVEIAFPYVVCQDYYLQPLTLSTAPLFLFPFILPFAVLLGVVREAAVVAAALGQPKGLFRTPSTLAQTDVDEFNR